MVEKNQTVVTEFLLLGFPRIGGFKPFFFLLILIAYIMTLTINLMIIILISTKQQLNSPMYFFFRQLASSEIVLITIIVPNMLHVIWGDGGMISVTGCIMQSYLYCSSGSTECYLLAAMAYDRYLAICNPLRYSSIMDLKLQYFLAVWCWVFGFTLTLITLALLCKLQFCTRTVIDHFFCDLAPFVEIACSDTSVLKIEIVVLSIPIILVPFILIMTSYVCIFIAILVISSTTGRQKAFSTCSSHLSVVCMFYGTLIITYLVPYNGHSLTINKVIAVVYTVIIPCFNPIIYSLRTKEIRVVMEKVISSKIIC